MTTWYGPAGPVSPLTQRPIPIHGTMTGAGTPLTIEGKRVTCRGTRYIVADGTNPVSAEAWEVELSDRSRWIVLRDLSSGTKWTGERIG